MTFAEHRSIVSREQVAAGSASFAAARVLLIALLFCAPLAFGSVEPWGWGPMALVAVAALLAWAGASFRNRVLVLAWSWLFVPGLVLLGFVLLQLYGRWSVDPASTSEATLKLAICLLIFFLTTQLYYAAPESLWERLGLYVLIYSSLVGLFGILQFFSAPGSIYWFGPSPNVNFGPYINRDHFAGLFEMLVPIAGAYYIAIGRKSRFSLLWGFALLIATASLLFAGSRGGLLSLVTELLVLIVIVIARTRDRKRVGLLCGAAGLFLAAVAFLLFLAPSELPARLATVTRFSDTEVTGNRPKVAHDTLRMFRDHLAAGTGLGTFEAVYPQYESFVSDKTWTYAHNDYAQLLAETGLPGGLMALLGLIIFVHEAFWIRLRSNLTGSRSWLQLGASLGCCGILVHSLVDFNLHIPANAAWFSTCAALATLRVSAGKDRVA